MESKLLAITFSPLGLTILKSMIALLTIFILFSSHTYSYLMVFFKEQKSSFFQFFFFLMYLQLKSLRYYQVPQAKNQCIFIENFEKMKLQTKKDLKNHVFEV
jgi:hypothetical protein